MKFKSGSLLVILSVILVVMLGVAGCGSSKSSSDQKKQEKTDYAVGEVISYDGKEITVVSVERNFDSGNSYYTADSGKEFVKINVKIENKSDSKISYNAYEWEIQDSHGDIQKVDGGLQFTADGALNSGELAPGGNKSADLYFQVPSGDAGVVLHYKPSFLSDKTLNIKL